MQPDQLRKVRRAAAGKRRAELAYHDSIVAAVTELEQAGARDAYAQVAAAAGVSRQAVRDLVTRART